MDKASFRRNMRAKLQTLTPEDIRRRSARIAAKLIQSAWWQETELILAFCAMIGEVDANAIIHAAFDAGKMVGVPRVAGADLIFHYIRNLARAGDFTLSPFGIKEPLASLPVVDFAQRVSPKCLIVTPGLAFDRQKHRLGRGKGFYDRFLPQARTARECVAIGVCFAEQLLAYVPAGVHDQAVDGVITEQAIIS